MTSAPAQSNGPKQPAPPVAPKEAPVKKPGPPGKPEASSSAKADSKSAGEKKKVIKGGPPAADKKPGLPEEPDMAQELVEEKAIELYGEEICNGLANNNWKERQQALESLVTKIKQMPSDDVPVQVIVRTLAKKPGFKDSHFQVLKQRLELITALADASYKFTQRSASYCIIEIADKIGDAKTAQQAKDALSKISEPCTLAYVCQQVKHKFIPFFVFKHVDAIMRL